MNFRGLFILLFLSRSLLSQTFVPLSHDFERALEQWAISKNINISTFTKPLSAKTIGEYAGYDSVFSFGTEKPDHPLNLFKRKLLVENLLTIDTTDFDIKIDPLFNLAYGQDSKTRENYITNTRGIKISGSVSKKMYFESSFYENQSTFPVYIRDYISSGKIVPGQGRIRNSKVSGIGLDYSFSTGILYYRYKKHWEFSFGQDKLFIGNGYRSLLLSDNSVNYPLFKVTATYDKIQYSRVMAILMSDQEPSDATSFREKKLAGFNILSFTPSYWFHVMLFEGSIWQYPNSTAKTYFDFNYLNPVIFINSIISSTKCKTLIGIGLKINAFKLFQMYGQITADKFPGAMKAKFNVSWQAGIKYFNAFSLRNFYLQAEYNHSQNKVYYTAPNSFAYTHFNQTLGHPLGVNYKELVFISQYNYRRLQVHSKFVISSYGNDFLILVSPPKVTLKIVDYPFSLPNPGMGGYTDLSYNETSLAFLINPKTNMKIEAGFISRSASVIHNNYKLEYFYFAFRTSLTNLYYEF
jgi:hypothetical protein